MVRFSSPSAITLGSDRCAEISQLSVPHKAVWMLFSKDIWSILILLVLLLSPKDNHANQDEGRGNRIADKVIAMDALTATKAVVLILDIKTIPAPFHLTNQPRQKFKLDLKNPCAV